MPTESPVLKSHVQTSSEEFRANAEHHRRLASELEARLTEARGGGGAEAREKHTSRASFWPATAFGL